MEKEPWLKEQAGNALEAIDWSEGAAKTNNPYGAKILANEMMSDLRFNVLGQVGKYGAALLPIAAGYGLGGPTGAAVVGGAMLGVAGVGAGIKNYIGYGKNIGSRLRKELERDPQKATDLFGGVMGKDTNFQAKFKEHIGPDGQAALAEGGHISEEHIGYLENYYLKDRILGLAKKASWLPRKALGGAAKAAGSLVSNSGSIGLMAAHTAIGLGGAVVAGARATEFGARLLLTGIGGARAGSINGWFPNARNMGPVKIHGTGEYGATRLLDRQAIKPGMYRDLRQFAPNPRIVKRIVGLGIAKGYASMVHEAISPQAAPPSVFFDGRYMRNVNDLGANAKYAKAVLGPNSNLGEGQGYGSALKSALAAL